MLSCRLTLHRMLSLLFIAPPCKFLSLLRRCKIINSLYSKGSHACPLHEFRPSYRTYIWEQGRQSGLISGGSWIRVKKFRIFQANFHDKIIIFHDHPRPPHTPCDFPTTPCPKSWGRDSPNNPGLMDLYGNKSL